MKQVIFKPKSLADYTAIVSHADVIGMRVHPHVRKNANAKLWRERGAFCVSEGRLMNTHGGQEVTKTVFKTGMSDCLKNNTKSIVLTKVITKPKPAASEKKMYTEMLEFEIPAKDVRQIINLSINILQEDIDNLKENYPRVDIPEGQPYYTILAGREVVRWVRTNSEYDYYDYFRSKDNVFPTEADANEVLRRINQVYSDVTCEILDRK